MSNRRAWIVCSLVLFALTAWPTWIVDLPPLQDLANHVASAWVQLHPERFPELASNGFLKTNSAFFLFMHVLAGPLGVRVAAKLFVMLVLATGAAVYPHTVARFGNGNVYSASFVVWPFVHNWFVAMGMLDYALGIPLTLATLLVLDRHRASRSLASGISAALLALLVWYVHAFAFMIMCLLVGVEVLVTGRPRELKPKLTAALRLVVPLVPAIALTLVSVVAQLSTETGRAQEVIYRSILATLYGAWAEWFWTMTKWTLVTIVPCAVVAYYGLKRVFRVRPPFFSAPAVLVMALLCMWIPHVAFRWFFFASRFIPYFWIGLVLRMPAELPRWLRGALAACAVAFSVGLGVEYVWLARDWQRVAAGESSVPVGSHLLTLNFNSKGRHGDNTWVNTHVWAFYTIDRDAMSPSFFAHSRTFPITYVSFPPRQFEQLSIEGFAGAMGKQASFCEGRNPVFPRDCAMAYEAAWREFWEQAAPKFDHVLLVDPTADVRAHVPPSFVKDYDKEDIVIFTTAALNPPL